MNEYMRINHITRLSMMACVNSVVVALPPTSPVNHFPYWYTLNRALSIAFA
jgi:hypothetical protein